MSAPALIDCPAPPLPVVPAKPADDCPCGGYFLRRPGGPWACDRCGAAPDGTPPSPPDPLALLVTGGTDA